MNVPRDIRKRRKRRTVKNLINPLILLSESGG
jgi:hypothetical protein